MSGKEEKEELEVTIEEEVVDKKGKKKRRKRYALAIAVAATYHPETNTIVIAAVCKDNDENPPKARPAKEPKTDESGKTKQNNS